MDPLFPITADCLVRTQRPDGSWCMPSTSDASFEIEMMFLLAFLDREHDRRWPGLMRTVVTRQRDDGCWADNVDQTLLARFALRLAGLDDSRPALASAADWLLGVGRGFPLAARTRLLLALFGQCDFPDPRELASACAVETGAMHLTTLLRPVRPWPRDPVAARMVDGFQRKTFLWRPWTLRKARLQTRLLIRLIDEQDATEGTLSIWPLIALSTARKGLADSAMAAVWQHIDARAITDRAGTRYHVSLRPGRDTARALQMLLDQGVPPTDPAICRGADWLARWLLRSPAADPAEIREVSSALRRCQGALSPERRVILDRAAS